MKKTILIAVIGIIVSVSVPLLASAQTDEQKPSVTVQKNPNCPKPPGTSRDLEGGLYLRIPDHFIDASKCHGKESICNIPEDILQNFIGVDTVVVSAKEKIPGDKSALAILHDRFFGNPLDVLTADMIRKVGAEYLKDKLAANHVQVVESDVSPPLQFSSKTEQRNVLFVHFEYRKEYGSKDTVNIVNIQILLRRNDFIPDPLLHPSESTPNRLERFSAYRIIGLEGEPVPDLIKKYEKVVRDELFRLTTDITCALDTSAQSQ